MTYEEFLERDHFSKQDLLAFAWGRLIKDPPDGFAARLPTPPMMMFDRITRIEREGRRGRLVAEQDIHLDAWYFQCHFAGDPVQPGCLGLDAVWQLLGFYCNWRGGLGAGRALGAGEVDFFGQIRPHDTCVRYEIDVRRYTEVAHAGASLIVGDGRVLVDEDEIYSVKGARVGLFRDISYREYPLPSEHATGGKMER